MRETFCDTRDYVRLNDERLAVMVEGMKIVGVCRERCEDLNPDVRIVSMEIE